MENDGDGGGGLPGFNMGSIQSLGIMNALKTGDPKIDMILALLMPFALKFLLTFAVSAFKFIKKGWTKYWYEYGPEIVYHERIISHSSQFNTEDGCHVSLDDDDSKNGALVKALKLYLHAKIDLKLTKASVDLSQTPGESRFGVSNATVISKCLLVKNPPANQWHKLGQHGKPPSLVELTIQEDSENVSSNGGDNGKRSESKVQTKTYRFRSREGQAIDCFLDSARKWYVDELRSMEDTSRYYYDLKTDHTMTITPSRRSHNRTYTRFKLSDEKTFDSLFFPEKEPILRLVDNFTDRKGKYSVKGYPQKLGLLLHGPPGTGKTSFVKALAAYTGRHVVNIPISKIDTNAELTSVFFDRSYQVEGGYDSLDLDFKDVIYVMEDIDAVGDVVKRRDGKKTAEVIQTSHIDMPAPKCLWRLLLESESGDCKALVKTLMGKSERLKLEAAKPDVARALTKRMNALPALGLVGETEDKTMQALLQDAISSSETLMKDYSAVDKYLGNHAKILDRLLQDGAEVDEALEDELLGIEKPCYPSIVRKPASRDVSYSKYGNSEDVFVQLKQFQQSFMPPQVPATTGAKQNGKDAKKTGNSPQNPYMSFYQPPDALNLQGILNILDGVVDTPSRIVIMTTNHPEQLDPALIRPGRIDKKLHLGYMEPVDVSRMLEHYFETPLSDIQKQLVGDIITGNPRERKPTLKLTPAQVEQMTSEFETVDQMIHALEEKASNIASAPEQLRGTSEIAFGL